MNTSVVPRNHHTPPGTVYLIGAGPGDPGLITVRGRALIETADVIVYDQLGAPVFLTLARPDAELIDVGKRAGRHTVPQPEINRLLVEHAQRGRQVVRLKGGDPMVFGRGGEELDALVDAGIPFEVVPGVSSAIAGPSYAGIPLTHRDCTTALAIATAHEADLKEESTIPWSSLSGINSTVFLMGVAQLANIVDHLLRQGRNTTTPIAIIENATTPRQRTVTGTLADIVNRAHEAAVKPPALIVVGEVVRFHDRFNWFEKRPLFGRSIAVTRASAQAATMADRLQALGAEVVLSPAITIHPIDPNPLFESFLHEINSYRDVVFTSVNGVEVFFNQLRQRGKDARLLAGHSIICIGPATGDACRQHGIIPDFIPETFVAESLLPWFQNRPPARTALLRAESARDLLPDGLRRHGCQVNVIPLYRTDFVPQAGADLLTRLRDNTIDAVTFTSSSTVDAFCRWLAATDLDRRTIPAVAIGPVTADTCRERGLQPIAEASVHTIPGLIDLLLQRFGRTS
ncbi:MAG TPA: uroporphyrinogen-III C-methyltransferase [Candidatus Ozemobacteraceae bacterium]|nr:uroporphyrinogen-III C-methyltransferase [Candidatus Ozemobacteraceae bacterium]